MDREWINAYLGECSSCSPVCVVLCVVSVCVCVCVCAGGGGSSTERGEELMLVSSQRGLKCLFS